MELREKEAFLSQSQDALSAIYDQIAKAPVLDWQELDASRTAVLVLDMINGFAKEGALSSPRVEAILGETARLCREAKALGLSIVAFADEHTQASPEFASFPVHCLKDTAESAICQELEAVGGYERIGKNSTNGFLEPAFARWLSEHEAIDRFVLIGDCTDICVLQMAQTLKAWFNRADRPSRLIVPVSAVETYTLGEHDGDLLNVMGLYLMTVSGIEIVQTIKAQRA